jgi:hypothetical protein
VRRGIGMRLSESEEALMEEGSVEGARRFLGARASRPQDGHPRSGWTGPGTHSVGGPAFPGWEVCRIEEGFRSRNGDPERKEGVSPLRAPSGGPLSGSVASKNSPQRSVRHLPHCRSEGEELSPPAPLERSRVPPMCQGESPCLPAT